MSKEIGPQEHAEALRQNRQYADALLEIKDVLDDPRADDAEKVRTIRRILRSIGMKINRS